MNQPEILLRTTVVDEFKENAVDVTIDQLEIALQSWPGVWWNAYSQGYGIKIKKFPYEARNGFFINIKARLATHRFSSSGIARRDELFEEQSYSKIVLPEYQPRWFDHNDAIRTYSILITSITKLNEPITVESFGLFNSWGKVSSKDQFHRPRLIKPTWTD